MRKYIRQYITRALWAELGGACDGPILRPTLRTKGGSPAPSLPRKREFTRRTYGRTPGRRGMPWHSLNDVHTLNLSGCPNVLDVIALGYVHTLNLTGCGNVTDVSALGYVHTLYLTLCPNVSDVSALGGTRQGLIIPLELFVKVCFIFILLVILMKQYNNNNNNNGTTTIDTTTTTIDTTTTLTTKTRARVQTRMLWRCGWPIPS
jgi:hypothetical protein